MFDLIGYWGAVTFFTSMILVWVLPSCILVLDYLIIMITKGDYKWVVSENTYKRFDEVFNEFWRIIVLCWCAGISNIAIFSVACHNKYNLIDTISYISFGIMPVIPYLSILALSWFGFLFLGRFIYSLSKDIATPKAKAAKEENNNE